MQVKMQNGREWRWVWVGAPVDRGSRFAYVDAPVDPSQLGLSFIPLATYWSAFNSLLKVKVVVNGIRDKILESSNSLACTSIEALYTDWRLTKFETIVGAFLFACLILFMGVYGYHLGFEAIGIATAAMVVAPFFGGTLFVWCGASDRRAIVAAMRSAALSLQTTLPAVSGAQLELEERI